MLMNQTAQLFNLDEVVVPVTLICSNVEKKLQYQQEGRKMMKSANQQQTAIRLSDVDLRSSRQDFTGNADLVRITQHMTS